MPLTDLLDTLAHFRDDREWGQYHTPPNLAAAIAIEAGELLELFQWGAQPETARIAEELADVLIYCLNMANATGLDVEEIVQRKIARNAEKYPAAGVRQLALPEVA